MSETAAFRGWKAQNAIEWFHGIGRLVSYYFKVFKHETGLSESARSLSAGVLIQLYGECMTTSDDHPYEIGRGRPPRHSQFRPGQSGNPSGRPKRRRSFAMDIAAVLDAPAGAGTDKTKQRAIAEDLVNAALARNGLAMKIITSIALALDHNEAEGDAPTPQERKLIEDFNLRQDSPLPSITDSQDGGHDD
jgi:Family of unknown function (DUF5681)